jgi:hypothetical protein
MVADAETTIFDVGANGEIDTAAFDYLGRLVPTRRVGSDRPIARGKPTSKIYED